jgi:osmoprotectant transport system permease protein
VPRDVLESADGSGYTPWLRFRRIEVPLATPLIVAGIRLATVSTIGLVTITGLLGDRFGGLGFFIFEGIRHVFPTEIFAGALASIVLAVAADLLLVAVQRRLTPWAPRPVSARGSARPAMT